MGEWTEAHRKRYEEKGRSICKEKVAFDSETHADRCAHRAKKIRGVRLVPYKCEYCPHWHLTGKKVYFK
jgi:hypothetical protein